MESRGIYCMISLCNRVYVYVSLMSMFASLIESLLVLALRLYGGA